MGYGKDTCSCCDGMVYWYARTCPHCGMAYPTEEGRKYRRNLFIGCAWATMGILYLMLLIINGEI